MGAGIGEAEMPMNFILNTAAGRGIAAGIAFYATADEALRGARFRLGNGAVLVWIVDRDGNLVLPADQVALRLESQEIFQTQLG